VNQPQVFRHETFGRLPVIVVDGMEWFGATEAAKALGFVNPHVAIQNHIDEDDLTVHEVGVQTGTKSDGTPAMQLVSKKFTNESGLYSLIFGAAKQGNNPEIQAKAREFKRWVTREVLPSIRRTGVYAVRSVSAGQEDPIEKADRILALAHKYAGILHPKLSAAIQIRAYEALTGRPAYEQDPLWQTFCEFADANGLPRPGRDVGVWWDESVSKLDDITLIALKRTLTARNPRIRRMREAVEAELRRREKEGVDAGVGI